MYIGPAELTSNVISFYNLNLEISKGRGLLATGMGISRENRLFNPQPNCRFGASMLLWRRH